MDIAPVHPRPSPPRNFRLLLATLPVTLTSPDVRGSVDVSGVQRLRLELTADAPVQQWAASWFVIFADPRLT